MDEFMERNTVERARETEIDTKNRIRGMDKRGEGEPAGTGKENKSLRLMTLLRVLLRKRFFNGTLKKKKKKNHPARGVRAQTARGEATKTPPMCVRPALCRY